MNVELKPIAESKVRQLGGDVCGVLVRKEDGTIMAVSEDGRCTRLDAAFIGPGAVMLDEPMGDEREAFEAGMKALSPQAYLKRAPNGQYCRSDMEISWRGFRAGMEAQRIKDQATSGEGGR